MKMVSFLRSRFGCLFGLMLVVGCLSAAENPAIWPAWWTAPISNIIDTSPGNTSDNWAIVNVGQLKNVATMAKKHLDSVLGPVVDWNAAYGGANPFPFDSAPNADNFSPANIGQLKFIASGFYKVLHDKAPTYDVAARLTTLGVLTSGCSSANGYLVPWGADGLENTAAANIGQLKVIFGFDLTGYGMSTDSNHDGIADLWELQYFGHIAIDPTASPAGDGYSNLLKFQLGMNPTVHSQPDSSNLTLLKVTRPQ